MNHVRTFWLRHRAMAILLVMAALCMKALVPVGYMIGHDSRVMTIEICADATEQKITKQIAIPMSGKDSGGQQDHGQNSSACPYSALSMASLAGADAAMLAIALAFILALGFAPVRLTLPKRAPYLHPPLRGPPALV